MDLNKTEHFLDFIFCNGLLQDAAYGTTKLNFFNGESQILPHTVITARYEHIISYYIKFCESKNFGMIIWDINRILKTLKPSHRRSVEGLDDTVGGLNGFIILKEIVDHYMAWRKAILEKLEQGKRYLNQEIHVVCGFLSS